MAFCFVVMMASNPADNPPSSKGVVVSTAAQGVAEMKDPVWPISINATVRPINWESYKPHPRFEIYEAYTSTNLYDGLVLDKETGLIWVRERVSRFLRPIRRFLHFPMNILSSMSGLIIGQTRCPNLGLQMSRSIIFTGYFSTILTRKICSGLCPSCLRRNGLLRRNEFRQFAESIIILLGY
jgi:hypothetical protein